MNRTNALSLTSKLGLALGPLAIVPPALYLALCAAGHQVPADPNALVLAGAFGALIAIATAVFLFRQVVRPLRGIAEAVDAMASGDPGRRIDLRRSDELGRLADAVDAMADRLQARHEELRRANARLEAEVADRSAALAVANERFQRELDRRRQTEEALMLAKEAAESANRTKTLFLANMSHELRTPLHAIIGFSEILESQLFGPIGNDRYRDYASDIRQSGGHLLRLINDILDVSRIEAGAFELYEELLNLPALVESCFQLVDHRAQDHGVRLRQQVPPDLPLLRGDAVRVKQILVNLLDNGIKFTPEGGLVSFDAEALADGAISIRVSDTGIGIAAKDLAKALSTFGQADSSYTRKHDGAGLGLPLAKALAEKHGGTFSIESQPGVGTRVTLLFPAERSVPAAPAAVLSAGRE